MIQFNLLPDVKLEYQRAQAVKRSVLSIAVIVAGGALAITVLLASVVYIGQKTHLHGLDGDIKKYREQLDSTDDLTKVLTIQNQLASLTCTKDEVSQGQKPCLHDKKPVATRLFGYLGQIIPANISIAKFNVKFTEHTMTFVGSADSLASVNRFVDTLKFTTYGEVKDGQEPASNDKLPKAFSSVVMTSFTRNEKDSTYTVDLSFDPAIFDSTKDVKLVVPPGAITTRSTTEKPTELFKPTSKTGKQ